MAPKRRTTDESAKTRTAILDATEKIMREEGYAGVSSRRVAERAGLKSQLVYYHFGTMDELFLAVYRRTEEQFFAAHAKAIAARNPLRALWELGLDPAGVAITQEFLALANHRKAIRREIVQSTVRFRSLQTAIVERVLEDLGMAGDDDLAQVLPFVIVSLSGALVSEDSLGISMGHAAVRALVERRLKAFEAKGGRPAAPLGPSA